MGRDNLVLFMLGVMTLALIGVVAVAFFGPGIFNIAQASVSTSVPTAPENQNSGILSTPTVNVVPVETLVPTITESPTIPPPTKTNVPTATPTVVKTEAATPATKMPTTDFFPPDGIIFSPFPESKFGVNSEYLLNIKRIEKFGSGFRAIPKYFGPILLIVTTGNDSEWTYFTVNGVALQAEPGVLLNIVSVPKGVETRKPEETLGGIMAVEYDPLAQMFYAPLEADVLTGKNDTNSRPNSRFSLYVHEEGNIELIGNSTDSCLGSYWKWKGSSTVYIGSNPCPSVKFE